MSGKTCTIIGGPNGAGKTTFALRYLPETDCRNFVNADLIAAGLSPLSPQREWLAASRLFLQEIHEYVLNEEDFAFETTLSGRSYLKLIRGLLNRGWKVHLQYLWLPTVELAIERVAERVAHGGHDIPREVIVRRILAQLVQLAQYYAPLCGSTVCMDNSGPTPELIFTQDDNGLDVEHRDSYEMLLERLKMTETQERARKAKEVLARAVAEALDRKQRLGQYAVIYQDGRIVRIEPEHPTDSERA